MQESFFNAVVSGDVDRLRSLLQRSPSLVRATASKERSPTGVGGRTGLHLAVGAGHTEIARVLVTAGIDIDVRDEEGRTALHDSIEYGRGDVERMLLDQGAQVDICAAAILGRIERVRECLDRDPEAVNDRSTGLSPLGWASFGNQAEIARQLIARGAKMNDGALLCAALVGHVEVGRVLLKHGADPDRIEPRFGGNALHAAAGMRYTTDPSRFVSMLLEAGADPTIKTSQGQTALQIAEQGASRQRENPPAPGSEETVRNYEGVAGILRGAPPQAG